MILLLQIQTLLVQCSAKHGSHQNQPPSVQSKSAVRKHDADSTGVMQSSESEVHTSFVMNGKYLLLAFNCRTSLQEQPTKITVPTIESHTNLQVKHFQVTHVLSAICCLEIFVMCKTKITFTISQKAYFKNRTCIFQDGREQLKEILATYQIFQH